MVVAEFVATCRFGLLGLAEAGVEEMRFTQATGRLGIGGKGELVKGGGLRERLSRTPGII